LGSSADLYLLMPCRLQSRAVYRATTNELAD
jgi:hypothetical protein